MNRPMIGLVLMLMLLNTAGFAQGSKWDKHAPPARANVACQTCHECSAPTKTNPCLSSCPRATALPGFHPTNQGPEVLIMGKVSKEYGPVIFSHRLHADMSKMSGGCYGCHHYNSTSMTILSCRECHPAQRARADISMPDLKGAYHRQCMGCHRQWSKGTECTSCHLKRGPDQTSAEALREARLKGKSHPELPLPKRVLYETPHHKGTFVSFFHDDHAQRFDLACTDCHRQETCIRCHEKKPQQAAPQSGEPGVPAKRSVESRHAPCFSCHASDKCEDCHASEPQQAFDHQRRAGWPLNRFHKALSCQKCHGEKKRFTKVDTNCKTCHKGWTPDAFKHEITGLKLDEAHAGLDCESCHTGMDFSVPPACTGCHDDKTYPRNRPGKMIRVTAR
jgi:hypothetical protein